MAAAAARFLVFSLSGRRAAAGSLLNFCSSSNFPFSTLFPPAIHLRSFSSDSCRRVPGLLFPPPVQGSIHSSAAGLVIELVDSELWHVSSALSQALAPGEAGAFRLFDETTDTKRNGEEDDNKDDAEKIEEGEEHDLDDIEELRLRKKLFYKLDRGSMEFEDCNLNLFHRQKKKSKRKQPSESIKFPTSPDPRKKEAILRTKLPKPTKSARSVCDAHAMSMSMATRMELDEVVKKKRERTPTFNQLTDPYHLPFCLDIYISKGSVRACIIHRNTSKVVVVAHSISKDMKFDLASRKDAAACTAVGTALAQRALSDDIHNVVYTPRKGEKIEGKLQIVLQAIIDNGIDVKVKIKQRKNLRRRMAAS